MKANQLKLMVLVLISAFVMMACSIPLLVAPVDNTAATNTAVAQTVEARLTQVWSEATATEQAAPATNTPAPTNTPQPTNTPAPTNTPQPTATATKPPVACNAAQFIKDMTIADGSVMPKGVSFTKIWRLKNIGSCTWTTDYSVSFDGGDKLGGSAVDMPKKVAPGEIVDISVPMKAPDEKGKYKGFWILRDDDGSKFGIGGGANSPFWVQITVGEETANHSFDFAAKVCQATWKTDDRTLNCFGTSEGYSNYVFYTTSFQMETDKWENEPAIIVNVETGERVRGTFPSYDVKAGDRFVAQIGCTEGNQDCKVKMVLRYKIKGTDTQGVLGEWVEKYDGKTTLVDLDLSSLAGKEVIFTMDMEAKSDSDTNEVFWFVPSIRNP